MIIEHLSADARVGTSASLFQEQGSVWSSPWQSDLIALAKLSPVDRLGLVAKSSLTSIDDPWVHHSAQENLVHTVERPKRLLISDLGWTPEQATEAYLRLRHFEEAWSAPGMDAYDDL